MWGLRAERDSFGPGIIRAFVRTRVLLPQRNNKRWRPGSELGGGSQGQSCCSDGCFLCALTSRAAAFTCGCQVRTARLGQVFRSSECPHLLSVVATTSGRAQSKLEEGQVSGRRGCEKGAWGRKAPDAGPGEQIVVSGQRETLNGEAGVQERTFSWCQTSQRGGVWSRRESGGAGVL